MKCKCKNKVLILIALIALGIIFISPRLIPSPRTNADLLPQIDSKMVTISIDYGNGETESLATTIEVDMTAYDLLGIMAKNENMDLKVKQYDFGVFVEAVGEYANNEDKVWIYNINGNSGQVAADKYIVQENDHIEWKFTEPLY